MNEPVVVTGAGCISPLGVGVEALFSRWCSGESGLEGGVGVCRDLDTADFLSKKETRRADRFSQLALIAAAEALAQAGLPDGLGDLADRSGCFVGNCFGGISSTEEQLDAFNADARTLSPLTIPLMIPNAAAANVCVRYGLRGPSAAVGTACAAGVDAIGMASRAITAGDADVMIAGGAESAITDFARQGALIAGAASPTGVSRPFDARRDGFVPAEGAGMLVLERRERARARGARVLGAILGYGSSTDAFHLSSPSPDGGGAALAMTRALDNAGLKPTDICYINAHGTGTPLNDRSETFAIKAVFGEAAYDVPISSTKSVIGHLVGAAGAVEAAVTLRCLQEGVIPPTVGYEVADPELDLDYVPEGPRPIGRRSEANHLVAMCNSFGFGGHNGVLCLAAG